MDDWDAVHDCAMGAKDENSKEIAAPAPAKVAGKTLLPASSDATPATTLAVTVAASTHAASLCVGAWESPDSTR